MINTKLESGEIEVEVSELNVLSRAEVPPFPVEDAQDSTNENTRLKYRYLDLRRASLQKIFQTRHKALQVTRNFFSQEGFLEIETPILYKSTPEGARDYLVPSRIYPGTFFALPQSPQTLKQLLMISGFEKYFQIARCFRDEDLRADRQPEFTQIDLEASFLSQNEFLSIIEKFVKVLWKEILGIDVPLPFPRMNYKTAIESYGSDKPDLRYGLELTDHTDLFKNSSFKVFSTVASSGGKIIGIKVTQSELEKQKITLPEWSRKDLDSFNTAVTPFGLKGVAWIRVKDGQWNSPISKFFNDQEQKELLEKWGLKENEYLLLGAAEAPRIYQAMGALRQHIAKEVGLVKEGVSSKWAFAWITEFPLFEYDPQTQQLSPAHHPFTRPLDEDLPKFLSGKKEDLKDVRAQAYDLALNGYEVAGGSLRIYDSEVQKAMFRALKLSEEEIKQKFGFFVEALKYGTPPHGGIAFGFDRLIMVLAGTSNIRDVIAFPKTASSMCLMSECPSGVASEQLAELKIARHMSQ
jgi:aspartyl-tRNA synthetase